MLRSIKRTIGHVAAASIIHCASHSVLLKWQIESVNRLCHWKLPTRSLDIHNKSINKSRFLEIILNLYESEINSVLHISNSIKWLSLKGIHIKRNVS